MKKRHTLIVFPILISIITMILTVSPYAAESKSASPGAALSSIGITPLAPRNLFLGEKVRFKATGTYADGSTADISSKVKWSLSNTTDVDISASGLLTVISKGGAATPAGPGGPTGPGEANVTLTASLSGVVSSQVKMNILTSEGPSVYLQSGGYAENSNQAISASGANQSGVKVTDKGVFCISDSTITTSGDSTFGGDSSSYGLNAGVLAVSGSKIAINNCIITTAGESANAVFAYGEGSVIELSNVKIKAMAAGGHGVDATYKGAIIIEDAYIDTYGGYGGAALSNDTGDGNVTATRVTAVTAGKGSPGFYAIGAGSVFKIKDCNLSAKTGEGGLATTGVTVFADNTVMEGSSTGVSVSGGSTFTMTGGSLISTAGPAVLIEAGPGKGRQGGSVSDFTQGSSGQDSGVPSVMQPGAGPGAGGQGPGSAPGAGQGGNQLEGIGVLGGEGPGGAPAANLPTSTLCKVVVKGRTIFKAGNGNLIEVKESSQGVFTAEDEDLTGGVIVDEGSALDITLRNSAMTGMVQGASITLESGSSWNVTDDSTITGLTDKGGISGNSITNIIGNGHTVYYDKDVSKELGGKTYSLVKGGRLMPKK